MNKFNNQIAILLLPVFLILQGCEAIYYKNGNGEIVVNSYRVDPFTSISLEGNFEVILEKGDRPGVIVKTDENLQDYIEVESRNNILYVVATERIRSKDGIKIMVSYTHLDKILSGGTCAIFTESTLKTSNLELTMSGAGIIEMSLDVKYLDVRLSGAGMMEIDGKCSELDLTMSGAGTFNGSSLETIDADVTISGVGGAKVNVSGNLVATVSGIGAVKYTGDPKTIRRNISGIGKIVASRE